MKTEIKSQRFARSFMELLRNMLNDLETKHADHISNEIRLIHPVNQARRIATL